MGRIRTYKPEYWTSEEVVECSRDARLLYLGLWSFCDDAGVMPLKPKQIKLMVFPGDEDLDVGVVRLLLDELSAQGLIRGYEVEGRPYLIVPGWDHQKIDRPTFKYPQASGRIPRDKGEKEAERQHTLDSSTTIPRILAEPSASPPREPDDPSPPEDPPEDPPDEKPKKAGGKKAPDYPEAFEYLWGLRPLRAGGNPKGEAFEKYNARLKEGYTHEQMEEGLRRYAAFLRAKGDLGTDYVMQVASFFGPKKMGFLEEWAPPLSQAERKEASSESAVAAFAEGETEGGD